MACCEKLISRLLHSLIALFFVAFWSIVTIAKLLFAYLKSPNTFFEKKVYQKPAVLDGWTHGFVQLKDVKLHYVEAGDLSNPLMILVHGFPEFWYSWRFQIRHFGKDHHVVAVDLRGYGDSDKPQDVAHYDTALIMNDIKELIGALGCEKAVLVGHDWGAAIAWRVAEAYPEVVDRLVVLNCPHPHTFETLFRSDWKQLLKSWYMFMFQCPQLPELALSCQNFKMLIESFRGKAAGLRHQENFTDEDEQAWLYTFSKKNAFTGPINFYRAALQRRLGSPQTYSLIKPKTLIIWGTEDHFIEKKGAELSLRYCENAQLQFAEGASHWVQQDMPEFVNQQIDQFLAQSAH